MSYTEVSCPTFKTTRESLTAFLNKKKKSFNDAPFEVNMELTRENSTPKNSYPAGVQNAAHASSVMSVTEVNDATFKVREAGVSLRAEIISNNTHDVQLTYE